MSVFGVFDQRVRGFRVIEIGALCVVLALALVVYLAKTHAGGQRDDIDRIQDQILAERSRIALLKAEVATLEQPERLETLSGRYLNLQPVPASHEIDPGALAQIARGPEPQAKAAPATAADSSQPAAPAPGDKHLPPAAAVAPPPPDDADRSMTEAAQAPQQ